MNAYSPSYDGCMILTFLSKTNWVKLMIRTQIDVGEVASIDKEMGAEEIPKSALARVEG